MPFHFIRRAYPILKAIGKENPVGLVHFDGHCDTAQAINCGRNSSGSICIMQLRMESQIPGELFRSVLGIQ